MDIPAGHGGDVEPDRELESAVRGRKRQSSRTGQRGQKVGSKERALHGLDRDEHPGRREPPDVFAGGNTRHTALALKVTIIRRRRAANEYMPAIAGAANVAAEGPRDA